MLLRENTGLIVVDIQGKLARLVEHSEAMINHCEKLIKGALILDLPIIWLEQTPDKLGPTVEQLSVLLDDSELITKYTFNACDSPDFLDSIGATNVSNWLICGIEAHICVYQTAKGLTELGYKVELVSDCIGSRLAANKQLAINALHNSSVNLTGLEMCLYELVKDCRDPEFKQILALIR